jgi:hypothetical protein
MTEAVIVTGNKILNCSIGTYQQNRAGVYYNKTLINVTQSMLAYTGSLFSFQDVLRVEFIHNTFENIKPPNNWDFYLHNSPFLKFIRKGVVTSLTTE